MNRSIRPFAHVIALAAFGAASGWGGGAHADDKQACLEAYDQAQSLRQGNKLVASREQLLICARNVCPTILRKDCTQWLSEVDASTPTVVLEVRSADGRDLVDVRVTIDGEPLVTQIDGKAVPVDPGVHTFRFEADGQETPIEERIVIHEGAKNRNISVKFKGAEEGSTAPGPVPVGDGGTKDTGVSDGGPSPLAYVFGGVGVIGIAGFTFFGLSFDGKLNDMDSCKPNCPQSDADDASKTRTMALISGGVGVVSLGVATVLFLSTSPGNEAPASTAAGYRLDLLPVEGGALGAVGGRF